MSRRSGVLNDIIDILGRPQGLYPESFVPLSLFLAEMSERERCDYRVRPSLKVAVDVGAGMEMRWARPAQFIKSVTTIEVKKEVLGGL